jgi:CheY-like chemotaxis protein
VRWGKEPLYSVGEPEKMKDILIVEDGKQERERLQRLFEGVGYAVESFENVTDAEKRLEIETFRLAILDIGLNDRSGSYLFSVIKRNNCANDVIIFTGNPSVHLKQRFMDEGAADYIVKASVQAQDENFLSRVNEILGTPYHTKKDGIDLKYFLENFLPETSKALFLDMDNTFPKCASCGRQEYVVTFSQQTQIPPEITGLVVCAGCGKIMDPEIE